MRLILIEDILTHEFIGVEVIPCLSIIHSNPVKNKFFWVEANPCLLVIHSNPVKSSF
jgi:hypothetical protein